MELSIQERLKDLRVERGLTPVSYTHLDVYKRQALPSSVPFIFRW